MSNYFINLYESLLGRTQNKLDWYECKLDECEEHLDYLHAVIDSNKTVKKATVKKTVKKASGK